MKQALGESENLLEDPENENKQLLQGLRDRDRDPNLKANNKFMEWLASNNVYVKTTSSWGRAPHPLVIASDTEADGETCGRGLLSREGMTEGELMMTIPLDLCLTKANAQLAFGQDIITDEMDEYIAIALLLMHETLKGSQSRWKPYFDILPTIENVYPSYMWKEEELEMLKGSPVYHASKSLRKKIEREYETVYQDVILKYPQTFTKASEMTLERFLWAFVMLFSRAARLSSKQSGEEIALVPYADLMNHNPYSNTYIDAQTSGLPLISRTEEVAVYSDRIYKKYEQVFINYGEKGNGDLLLLYGFALDRNPFDSVDISVGLSKEDPLFQQKKAYLDKAGRGATNVRFPLQRSRYPSELVDFLRLLLAEADDLGMQTVDQIDFNEAISPSLERRVLQTIISICESYLEQYPNPVEGDDILMNDRAMFGALSRFQRMAVKLRASEKRILLQTITAVEQELQNLPKDVTADGVVVPAGRSFDVLNTRTRDGYVRNKSVASTGGNSIIDIKNAKEEQGSSGDEKEGSKLSIAERRRRRRSGGDQ
eukprot:scaffold326_cov169-Ochromonas_danica.AAC.8